MSRAWCRSAGPRQCPGGNQAKAAESLRMGIIAQEARGSRLIVAAGDGPLVRLLQYKRAVATEPGPRGGVHAESGGGQRPPHCGAGVSGVRCQPPMRLGGAKVRQESGSGESVAFEERSFLNDRGSAPGRAVTTSSATSAQAKTYLLGCRWGGGAMWPSAAARRRLTCGRTFP